MLVLLGVFECVLVVLWYIGWLVLGVVCFGDCVDGWIL